MLTTSELQKYILNEIKCKLGDISYNSIFFKEGLDNSEEGTYIFSKGGKYHILYTEKGEIRNDMIVCNEREVLWNVLETLSVNISLNYAIKNQEKGKDFRRPLFKAEKELFSQFGEDFSGRKNKEIENILKNNPFNDI